MSALRFVLYKRNLKRRAQALRRDPSPAERKLWYEFLRSYPRKFTRQKPLGRYIADFYCSQLALVVEVDGDSHFSERAQDRDSARSAAISAYGVRVIRFTNLEVLESFEGVCRAIDTAAR